MSQPKSLTDLPEHVYKTYIEPKLPTGEKVRLLATSKRFTMSPSERKKYKKMLHDLKEWAAKTNSDYINDIKKTTTSIPQYKIINKRTSEYEQITQPFLTELSPEDYAKFEKLLDINKAVNHIHFRKPFDFSNIPEKISSFNRLLLEFENKELRSILATAYMASLEEFQEEYKELDEEDILPILAFELNARIMLSEFPGYDKQVQELTDIFKEKLKRVKSTDNLLIQSILSTKPTDVTDAFIRMAEHKFMSILHTP